MHEVELTGCTTEPLLYYLKALGVIRLIAEQADPNVVGAWRDGVFVLNSKLDVKSIEEFFCQTYQPTPVVAPWNGGSGFYEGDKIDARDTIRSSASPRFQGYRGTINTILSWPELPPTGLTIGQMVERIEEATRRMTGKTKDKLTEMIAGVRKATSQAAKAAVLDGALALTIDDLEKRKRQPADSPHGNRSPVELLNAILQPAKKLRSELKKLFRSAGKEQLILACRNRLSDATVKWMDAVVIVGGNGKPAFPPLLGSGGNEGRLDYTNAFMTAVSDLLLGHLQGEPSCKLLHHALFGGQVNHLQVASVGQHDPGRAGGFNQGPEIETKDIPVNPWDFVLAIEGTIAWASGVGRRHAAQGPNLLSSPFTVQARAIGYGSSATKDETKGREIWAPLWTRPVTYRELHAFIGEGRAETGRKRAVNALEFAEAATSLGVDRGVTEFARFSLLQRRGQSNIALPTGRFPVQTRRESDLIRELDPLLGRLDRFLQLFPSGNVPARFASCRREIDERIYELLLHGGRDRVTDLVATIGRMEQLLATRPQAQKPQLARPLSGLSPYWIRMTDTGRPEVRLAAALASIAPEGEVGPIRANLAPVDPAHPDRWTSGNGQTTWSGVSLGSRLAAVLARRMMDADRLKCTRIPLWGALRVRIDDVMAFTNGDLDEQLTEDLLFGFTWIRWQGLDSTLAREIEADWNTGEALRCVSRAWAMLKLLFWPAPLCNQEGDEISMQPEPSIIPLLSAGRITEACRLARRRLFASGLNPAPCEFPDGDNGCRLAAALLVPVRPLRTLTQMILYPRETHL
jgi:CRISPR-associated protein Csx17